MDDPATSPGGGDCADATLVPEGSVPVAGFSRELRGSEDVERYRFSFSLRGGPDWPVHVVFSPSARRAEIKAADLKVRVIENVASASEARARWISWWRRGRSLDGFSVPRRAGRAPVAHRPAS